MKSAEKDEYSSLSERQPLVQANKLSKSDMKSVLRRFGEEIFERHFIWAELLDWLPERRMEGYELPKGCNAVIYRNWRLVDDELDVSKADVIPVRWKVKDGVVGKRISKLSIPEGTRVRSDKKYSIANYDGLNALLWILDREELKVISSYSSDWYSFSGVLLGKLVNDQ